MNRLRENLLYAGLSRETFRSVWPQAVEDDRKMLEICSLAACLILLVIALVNQVTKGFAFNNQMVYSFMVIIGLVINVCAAKIAPKHPRTVLPLAYAFIAALLLFGMDITLRHPDQPAVTFLVMLVLAPFIFADRPIRSIVILLATAAAFCVLTLRVKERSLAVIDIWNALSFTMLAVFADVLQMRTKFRVLAQEREIRYLSETDLLTGTKNRNCYELRFPGLDKCCEDSLTCIYADVNDLHRLNNEKGHAAGDRMLQTVARSLLISFGEENVYRIGGDEFVVFCPDRTEENIPATLAEIEEELAKDDYHISAGYARQETPQIHLISLTAEAERRMYEAKENYYRQIGNDRRSR